MPSRFFRTASAVVHGADSLLLFAASTDPEPFLVLSLAQTQGVPREPRPRALPSRISLCHGCVPFCASLSGTYSIVSIKHCSISVSQYLWHVKVVRAVHHQYLQMLTLMALRLLIRTAATIMSGTESFLPPLPRNVAASRQAFRSSSSNVIVLVLVIIIIIAFRSFLFFLVDDDFISHNFNRASLIIFFYHRPLALLLLPRRR